LDISGLLGSTRFVVPGLKWPDCCLILSIGSQVEIKTGARAAQIQLKIFASHIVWRTTAYPLVAAGGLDHSASRP
jgi:hypothetical protein